MAAEILPRMVLDANSFVMGSAAAFGGPARAAGAGRDLEVALSQEAMQRLGTGEVQVKIPFRHVASFGCDQIRLDESIELLARHEFVFPLPDRTQPG